MTKIRSGYFDDPRKRGVKRIKKAIKLGEGTTIEVVELTQKAIVAATKYVGGTAKYGIRGISRLGRVATDIVGEAGGVVTKSAEVPVDAVFIGLREANKAASGIRKAVKRM